MKKFFKIIGVIFVICILLIAGLIGWWDFSQRMAKPDLPAWADNLPSNNPVTNEGSKEFDKRVKQQFKIGTPVKDLIHTLADSGFKSDWSSDGWYSAKLTYSAYFCRYDRIVRWQESYDKNERFSRIANISGTYWVSCP